MIPIDTIFMPYLTQIIENYVYNKIRSKNLYTSTLLIHNLKYLYFVSLCFTKGKNQGRV